MASAATLAWIDRLAWIFIYGGLFAILAGWMTGDIHLATGWSLGVLGGIAVGAGIVLIVIRSRLHEAPAGDAQ